MAGRSTFTAAEVSELRTLIRAKQTADRGRQKTLRARMRRLGFYITDFADYSGFTVSDLDDLIRRGTIVVVPGGEEAVPSGVALTEPQVSAGAPRAELADDAVRWYDELRERYRPRRRGAPFLLLASAVARQPLPRRGRGETRSPARTSVRDRHLATPRGPRRRRSGRSLVVSDRAGGCHRMDDRVMGMAPAAVRGSDRSSGRMLSDGWCPLNAAAAQQATSWWGGGTCSMPLRCESACLCRSG
jgi:hypothetical protein